MLSNSVLDCPQLNLADGEIVGDQPTLAWTAVNGAARYDLWINYTDTGFAPFLRRWDITETEFTPPLPIPEGNYTVEIRAIADSGIASAWSPKVAFRVDLPTPTSPTLEVFNGTVSTTRPVFQWRSSGSDERFDISVHDLTHDNRPILRNKNLTLDSWKPAESLAEGDYRFWVRSANRADEWSRWSSGVTFSVAVPRPSTTTIVGPVRQEDGSLMLSWNRSPWVNDLWVNDLLTRQRQVFRDERFTSNTWLANTDLSAGHYRAWVRGVNELGVAGPWGEGFNFRLNVGVPVPSNFTSPVVFGSEFPTITWTASEHAVRYDLWINHSTSGKSQIVRQRNLTTTAFTPTSRLPDGSYQAWVTALGPGMTTGRSSPRFEFEIHTDRPGLLEFTAPDANVDRSRPTFAWTTDARAARFELRVDNLTNGQRRVITEKHLAVNSYTPTLGLRDGRYRGWVRAWGADDRPGPWSRAVDLQVACLAIDAHGLCPDDLSRMQSLWTQSVSEYLADPLWIQRDRYDAGVRMLMLIHGAFQFDQQAWLTELADHYRRAASFDHSQITREIDRLQYFYSAAEFVRLAAVNGRLDLVSNELVSILYAEIGDLWLRTPAGNWFTTFPSMRERVTWKLANTDVRYSYYRAVHDSTLMVMAVAADLRAYERLHTGSTVHTALLDDVLGVARQMYEQEGVFLSDGSWIFQPGVWQDYYAYQYAGYESVVAGTRPAPVPGIGEDSGHASRYPALLQSMAGGFESGTSEHTFYQQLRSGYRRLITTRVLVEPDAKSPTYRLTNFIDGSNGVYRWNYPTLVGNTGILPYELSSVMLHGWYGLMGGPEIHAAYETLSSQFPLAGAVLSAYFADIAIREQHPSLAGDRYVVGGIAELEVAIAASLSIRP
ncbi:MAG: hypothetical protein O3A00_25890 [Planctomycetota bacterium]|nr:hypothetical protein [Planctomycetota bacterium]